jgi:hypothetical protein
MTTTQMVKTTGRARSSRIVHDLRGRPGHWHTACGAGEVSTMARRSSSFIETRQEVTCQRCIARKATA